MYICLQIPRKNNLIRKNNLVFSISKSSRATRKEGRISIQTLGKEETISGWATREDSGGPVS